MRPVVSPFVIVLTCAVFCVGLGDAQGAEEYSFVKMWPELPQPWYFASPTGLAVDGSGNVYVADTSNDRIQKFTSEGVFITKWGKYGSGDAEFDEPRGMATDASGNLYVADTENYRIQKFTSDGSFITRWGSEGSGRGEFDEPRGVAVDGSGNVYVVDTGNHRIQKFRRSFGMRGATRSAESPTIKWDSESGKSYAVWLSADLFDWVSVAGMIAGSETGISSWSDDGSHPFGPPSSARCRFYRIELLPWASARGAI